MQGLPAVNGTSTRDPSSPVQFTGSPANDDKYHTHVQYNMRVTYRGLHVLLKKNTNMKNVVPF